MTKQEKVVVTGGAGFIGSHLVLELLKNNYAVTVVDNLSSGKQENLDLFKNVIEFFKIDINDTNAITKIFKNARYIFHLAAIPAVPKSIEDPIETNHANIDGTVSVLVAARDAGVQKVIFTSSASVYGNSVVLPKTEDINPEPLSPYAIQKLTGEQYMSAFRKFSNLETVSLRYFNVYGPRQDSHSSYATVIPLFIETLKTNKSPIIHGDGKMTRDFIYVEDVAKANVLVAESTIGNGDVFNIASGKPTSINELFSTIKKVVNANVEPKYGPARIGDIQDSYADITKAERSFGFRPLITLDEGIQRTVSSLNLVSQNSQ